MASPLTFTRQLRYLTDDMPIVPKFRVAKINHKPKSFSVTDDDEDPLPKSEKKTRKKGGKKSGPVYIDDSGSLFYI